MIASPGDTRHERDAIEKALHGWNSSRTEREQIQLAPWRWETHSESHIRWARARRGCCRRCRRRDQTSDSTSMRIAPSVAAMSGSRSEPWMVSRNSVSREPAPSGSTFIHPR